MCNKYVQIERDVKYWSLSFSIAPLKQKKIIQSATGERKKSVSQCMKRFIYQCDDEHFKWPIAWAM